MLPVHQFALWFHGGWWWYHAEKFGQMREFFRRQLLIHNVGTHGAPQHQVVLVHRLNKLIEIFGLGVVPPIRDNYGSGIGEGETTGGVSEGEEPSTPVGPLGV